MVDQFVLSEEDTSVCAEARPVIVCCMRWTRQCVLSEGGHISVCYLRWTRYCVLLQWDETLCEVERSEVDQCFLDRVDQSTCVEQEQCVLQCMSQSVLPLVVY